MHIRDKRRLEQGGALFRDPNGHQRVRITLQITSKVPFQDRSRLHTTLCELFQNIADHWTGKGVEIDVTSVSDLAQSVRASLPLSSYESLARDLERAEDVRIDPIVRQQVV